MEKYIYTWFCALSDSARSSGSAFLAISKVIQLTVLSVRDSLNVCLSKKTLHTCLLVNVLVISSFYCICIYNYVKILYAHIVFSIRNGSPFLMPSFSGEGDSKVCPFVYGVRIMSICITMCLVKSPCSGGEVKLIPLTKYTPLLYLI